jgi:purine-cytosine permease-like protein
MAASQQPAHLQRPPEWGIQPVPRELRVLGFLDQAVLWGNLGISLLVLVAGALLVPALGLWSALAATVLGAAIGNALLGLAAVPASQTGVPTMVLYRAPLGLRGSLLPTACNVVQNLGWATFELFVIASAATQVSERVLGFRARLLWVVVFGAITTAMAVAGPLTVIRRWLERFAIWAVLASTVYLTWYALPGTRWPTSTSAGWPPGAARAACRSGPGSTSPSPCRSRGCRWWPTTPASAAPPRRPSGGRLSAISWRRSGSTPSVCCSCSASATAT